MRLHRADRALHLGFARSGPEVHAYADRWGDTRGYSIWGAQANRVLLNPRGVALADFDNDSDADLVLTRQFDPVRFYEDRRSKPAAWVGFDVAGDGVTVNKDAAGSVLAISRDGQHWRGGVLNITGFSAQGDRRVVIGLGGNGAAIQARIHWTDGTEQDLGNFESGRYHSIRKTTSVLPVSSPLEDYRLHPISH